MSEIVSYVWEDREIKFDISNIQTKLRGGEKVLDILDSIEDTKGNPGDFGRLLLTNLRIIWYSVTTPKFSISVGYGSILTMTTKTVLSKHRGTTEAIYILTVNNNSRFEFIFTNLKPHNQTNFKSMYDIYKLYQGTHLYRELKLRSSVVSNGQLNVLPNEQVYNTLNGVWNLSSDQGNLGTFLITNIRVVWFADVNEIFNLSLPYMQILSIRIRESKYGPALVLSTLDTAGGYILGFRIDPTSKLHEIYKELVSLHTVYAENPIFGITYSNEQRNETTLQPEEKLKVEEIEEVDESKEDEINMKYSTYQSEFGETNEKREIVYCRELGFAMEKIRDGYTLKDLWNVVAP